MFKVFNKPCSNCLLSDNRIVSEERAEQIETECVKDNTHFVCHKASMKEEDTCCSMFFNKHKNNIAKLQIFQRLGMVQKVQQDPNEPHFKPYKEIKNAKS